MSWKSSFCGKIDEIPGVFVDNFEDADSVKARAYFLSHCHTDHTQGLYSDTLIRTLEKSRACLYMSESTAAVIIDESDNRLTKYIKPLKLGTTPIMLPADPQRNFKEVLFNVSLIPAGHSFGSVMFLFKTNTKTILFTGDFRMEPNDVPKYGHLHKNNEPIQIDVMYVDTTFFGPRYANFPKRSESIESAIEEINKWLDNDENNMVALHTSAKYGYEFVYNEIYNKLGLKVYVNELRWRFYRNVPHLVPGVTNEEKSTKIHLCRNRNEHINHTTCLTTIQNHTKFLFIHFSAMKWEDFNTDCNFVKRLSENRLDVCFATHCSKSELLYFVNYFSPKKVVGFPNPWLSPEKKVEAFQITPTKRKMALKEVIKPKIDKKVDSELLKKIFEM